MPELIAKSALDGRRATIGALTLAEASPGPITAIALFPGQEKAAAKALKPLGLTFPAPGTQSARGEVRLVWTGRDQAFLIGAPAPALDGIAAVTDQTDGWACLHLTGPGADAALMRLVALDLRAVSFSVGRTARTGLNHMNCVLTRTAEATFEILVFRSMARTAFSEIAEAMTLLDARAHRG